MPARHDIDIDNKLITTTWHGDATDGDFIDSLKKYQEDIQTKVEYRCFDEVFDCTGITKIRLTTTGLRKIASLASRTDDNKCHTRLAFIVSSDLAYGLVRMYDVLRSFEKRSTKEIRVFRKKDEAFEWIQGQHAENL